LELWHGWADAITRVAKITACLRPSSSGIDAVDESSIGFDPMHREIPIFSRENSGYNDYTRPESVVCLAAATAAAHFQWGFMPHAKLMLRIRAVAHR
jgi:hypothetical protein